MSCPPLLPTGALIVGVDEAGRGPLAGPVVAAAVALGPNAPDGLADSKVLSAKRRAGLDPLIRTSCRWGIGVVEADEIDRINIFAATMKAMTLAVAALLGEGAPMVLVLIDGSLTPHGRVPEWRWPARAIVGGDASEPAISAASILAKQHRDAIMHQAARQWPHYGWDRNVGYGTREHLDALQRHGPCPLHRRSFAPVAQARLI
jgi:ribonuclease HII